MEFLMINNNKLKVVINKDDMEKYEFAFECNEKNSTETRRALWRVLDAAQAECGFSASGDRLLIQFYPNNDGGEIFVTKIGKVGASAERGIALSQNVAMLSSRRIMCRFNEIGEVIKFCRGLSEEAKENTASLYYSEDGVFYLVYDERNASPLSELNGIFEFGDEIPITLESYIAEHSAKISGGVNAFRVLSEL